MLERLVGKIRDKYIKVVLNFIGGVFGEIISNFLNMVYLYC